MICREFISKHVESIATKIDPELDIVEEIERQVKSFFVFFLVKGAKPFVTFPDRKAASGRLLFLLDGLDEITGVASLSRFLSTILERLLNFTHSFQA